MGIRFLFFISLFFVSFFFRDHSLYAACDKENSIISGSFVSCGLFNPVGDKSVVEEFGTPQKLVDEDKPEGPLTPIEPTTYRNNPNKIKISAASNVKFHFFNFENDVTINVMDASMFDLQLYKNTTDITLKIDDEMSRIVYTGGNKGKTSVYLPACLNDYCFRTDSDIDYLDFTSPDFTKNGKITVGVNNTNDNEKKTEITFHEVKGNGTIELSPGSKLTIKHYEIGDWNDNTTAIMRVRGQGEVIFDTEVFVRILDVENATFNEYSKILKIQATAGGSHIFNANSDIGDMDNMNKMFIGKNVHIKVKSLGYAEEINVAEGATIEFIPEGNTSSSANNITRVQGEGIVHINPDYQGSSYYNRFSITDVNLNTLKLDEGELVISNSTPTYTITEKDSEGKVIKEEIITRRIKHIKQTEGAKGGHITVEGTVVFDNIDHLKKLTLCNSSSQISCNDNANLTIKKVGTLESLEINKGKLYLWVDHTNYFTPSMDLKTAYFNGGEFFVMVRDTNTIRHKNTYTILSVADKEDLKFAEGVSVYDKDNFKTALPDWYRYNYFLSEDEKTIMFEAERLAKYNSLILESYYADERNVVTMSSYFDEIIDKQIPLNFSTQTFTYVDILSKNDKDLLGYNMYSLIPIGKEKYIRTAHSNLKNSLEISKRNGIVSNSPYGLWDKKQGVKVPDDNVWFVQSFSNGQFDDILASLINSYDSMLFQFGYNLYNWVSNDQKEGYSYSVVGGFSKNNMKNLTYNSESISFNIGNTFDYRDENDIIKLSFIYGLSSFNTEKDYFIKVYKGEDFSDLDKSRLKSSLRTHEFLFDIQYSHEIFVEYLKSFANFNNVTLVPRVYITPSIFVGEEYNEKGQYSSIISEYYISSLLESGIGFDLSKSINFTNRSSIKMFFGADTWYKYYYIPSNNIRFEEVSSGAKMYSKNWQGFAVSAQTGVSFDYKSSQVIAYYKRENAKGYYQNIVSIGYKYSF